MHRSVTHEILERRTLLSTYYVSTAGNNTANGSSGSPWRTLQYAADHVIGGDTVDLERDDLERDDSLLAWWKHAA